MSRTLDDGTFFDEPTRIPLSTEKLALLRPDLCGARGVLHRALVFCNVSFPYRVHIREALWAGHAQAAVVVSMSPLLVAAHTVTLDCVAMLRFDNSFVEDYGLDIGSRLLAVNTYDEFDIEHYDLIFGPKREMVWNAFHPLIADFLTESTGLVEEHKRAIPESEWVKAYELGVDYIARRPGVARDGRPIFAGRPAAVPRGLT